MMTERLINFQYDGESDPYAPNIGIIINSNQFSFLISTVDHVYFISYGVIKL